ncbi:MAG TPA: pyridoxal phosphate-dependent aminotransferase family protein [Pricia sp.]|nr:pyridoxal phosphate-dependent aminotransferase family protein [Pricia sp.]
MANYIGSFPGREITVKGKKHLYFGGTAYLGLQTDEAFQNLLIDNIKQYGTHYGASRKSNLRLSIFGQAEKHLALWVGAEACATLSSGYLAGQLVAQALNTKKHRFFYAPNSHTAMYPVPAKSYTTFTALNIAVREHLRSQNGHSAPVVFMDAIDFSGCNYPDFKPLQILPLDSIVLVVDDSHGLGVVGQDGSGVYRMLSRLPIKELVVCCSLGKGLGIQGGAIFGTKNRIDELKDTAFFGGAGPAAPAALATLLEAEGLYSEKRKLLNDHIDYFIKNMKHPKKFHCMERHPAFTFSDIQMTEFLAANNIMVTSFPYPENDSQLMSRIVLSAAHTPSDIERLLKSVNVCPY